MPTSLLIQLISLQYNIVEIVKKFTTLHEKYSSKIIAAMQASVQHGTPVNPPIWWVDPTDARALATDDGE